jgi:hypothetical protein
MAHGTGPSALAVGWSADEHGHVRPAHRCRECGPNHRQAGITKQYVIALSDELTKLASRAREAEERVAAATKEALQEAAEAEYAVLYATSARMGRRQPGREIGLTRLRLMSSSEAVNACRRSSERGPPDR